MVKMKRNEEKKNIFIIVWTLALSSVENKCVCLALELRLIISIGCLLHGI